jgi:cation diffusion facilitator family transporter
MSIGRAFEYPSDKQELRKKTKQLSWLSIVLLSIAGTFVFLTVGQSQAMKTAWISDFLTAVPPAALLLAMRYELRQPTKRFPFGYTRSIAVAFLVTAGTLSLIGIWLLYDSLMKLVMQQRPPIGTKEIFGHQLWLGWLMIAALGFSLCCGLLIGLLKKPIAKKLNDKALNAESTMNRDEWLSEGAAILGILLVGFGHWWGDAAAAAFISIEMVHDGWINMRLVIADLMDESPSRLGSRDLEDIAAKLQSRIEAAGLAARVGARLREHGRAVTGELFVVLGDGADPTVQIARIVDAARDVDWRLHDLVVMPVPRLDSVSPPTVVDLNR